MHLTTMALVLRDVAYRDSDKLLTILTETEGKLTVAARRCRAPRSPLAAGSQLLVWGEFTLFEYMGRWAVREILVERTFRGVRRDLDRLALASYLAEVTESLAGEGQTEQELLSLTLNCLHALDRMPLPLTQVKAAFEWRAMAVAGYAPDVERCAVCGRTVPEEPCLNLNQGTLHCAACRDRAGTGLSMPLTPGALLALRHILWGEPKRLLSFRADQDSLDRLSQAGEAFVMNKLERGFHTLDFYKSMQNAQ